MPPRNHKNEPYEYDGSLKNADCRALVEETVKRMKLTPDETERFRHATLTRAGFKPVTRWTPGNGEDNQDDDDDYGF